MTYEQNPNPYAPPPASGQPRPHPMQPAPPGDRRSPVLGYAALGVAVLGLVLDIIGQVVQQILIRQAHYSTVAFGLYSGVSATVSILIDLVVVGLGLAAVFTRRGTVPGAIALGAGAFGLVGLLGSLAVNYGLAAVL